MLTQNIKSYIAGFLDGDGSIFLQLVHRKDYIYGYQIRACIVFYQHKKQKAFLEWLKEELQYGYIRERKDNMAEYTIVGYKAVEEVLRLVKPYVMLKKAHINLALQIIDMIKGGPYRNTKRFLNACVLVDKFEELNYSKKRLHHAEDVKEFFEKQKILSP